jgi:hypothetical protein
MTIRFDDTLESLQAFARYHYAVSPGQQKMRKSQYLTVWGFLFVAVAVLAIHEESWRLFICGVAGIAITWAFMHAMRGKVETMYLDAVTKQVKTLYAEGENKVVFGPREMEVTPEFLVKRSPVHEFLVRWTAIEKIVESLDHGYIYWSGCEAHAIPKNQLSKEDYRAFMDAAKRAWEAARKTLDTGEREASAP